MNWLGVPASLTLEFVKANRIKEIRLQRAKEVPGAFTMEEVARRAGVALNTLRRWEAGEARPRLRHVKALARALGVKVEELGLDGEAADA